MMMIAMTVMDVEDVRGVVRNSVLSRVTSPTCTTLSLLFFLVPP